MVSHGIHEDFMIIAVTYAVQADAH